jgi:hypothetical protein
MMRAMRNQSPPGADREGVRHQGSTTAVDSLAGVETIVGNERAYAYVVRAAASPPETTFITPGDSSLQLGFIARPAGAAIARHVHLQFDRHLTSTSEALLVRRGRCEVDIYDDARALLATVALAAGDLILMLGGGHGLRTQEDTLLLELKQGPYAGDRDKKRF